MKKILSYLLFVIIGFSFCLILLQQGLFKEEIANSKEIRSGNFKYINPLLECESDEGFEKEKRPSKEKIEEIVSTSIEKGKAEHVSVYFRDLNNGPWFGINEREVFSPASLFKVPIMMTLYSIAEDDEEILKKEVEYKGDEDFVLIPQNYKPDIALEKGKKYSLEELAKRMIVYSDNLALYELVYAFDEKAVKELKNLHSFLGIKSGEEQETVSIKNYASFFRVLFNASYLNMEYSEKALELLAQVPFENGLRAGVPSDITIAHKFGERKNGAKQLHDCGIIYYPNRPYLLCVMTRGSNFSSLEETIGEISKAVFEDMKEKYPRN